MVSFNLAGSLLSAGGVVTAIGGHSDRGHRDVHIDIWMRSDQTLTVTGAAVVSLPFNGNFARTNGSIETGDQS